MREMRRIGKYGGSGGARVGAPRSALRSTSFGDRRAVPPPTGETARRCRGDRRTCGRGGRSAPSVREVPGISLCDPATDLEILSLLLAGMTDASVARQLDLDLRTLRRRVKGLMELAEVTTRLQLGRHAYERPG